jgi:hypothetical protein
MSLNQAQLLTVYEAMHDKCVTACPLFFVFPTETRFIDKSDYWKFVNDANNTQREIETTLINGIWISYVRFEDDPRSPSDSPLIDISFDMTVFTEASFERLDETNTPDAFNAKVSVTDLAHDVAVFALKGEFQGESALGLDSLIFTLSETTSLKQNNYTTRQIACGLIDDDVIGSQTHLIGSAKIQLVAC